MMRAKKVTLDRQLSQVARKDDVCKHLMTVSGVGPIVSLSFKATIDDPSRFKDSKAVAAHLGLTPRVYQSGEIDRSGNISKCGDKMMRHALYEAANSHSIPVRCEYPARAVSLDDLTRRTPSWSAP